MSGHADIDQDVLVDSLVEDVVDGLRGDLHPQFGVRPYRAFFVRRTWTGALAGQGTYTDILEEIEPQPDVSYRSRYELTPNGRKEVGTTILTEVSLTYSYTDLTGGSLPANAQWFIMLREAQGQGQPDRFFALDGPPQVDRERDMGWRLALRNVQVPGCAR